MNPEIPEVPNPLSSARIVSRRTPNRTYMTWGSVREDGTRINRGDKDFVMSRSQLCEFNRCPARWRAGYREDGDTSTEWGALLDSAVFGVDSVEVCPDEYENSKGAMAPWTRQSKTCRAWEDERERAGIVTASAAEWQRVRAAMQVLNPYTRWEFNDVQVMLVSQYEDKETGLEITLKHLADWLPSDQRTIYDLKSSKSANPATWGNAVHSYGYHIQGAMELDAANLACPSADYVSFNHLVQESFPPYHTEEIMLSESWIMLGRLNYASALRNYCKCLATGIWPGYPSNQKFGRASLCEPRPWHLEG